MLSPRVEPRTSRSLSESHSKFWAQANCAMRYFVAFTNARRWRILYDLDFVCFCLDLSRGCD